MKIVGVFLVLLLAVFNVLASDAPAARTESQVRQDLIYQLERDGLLNAKQAAEARQKYIGGVPQAATGTSPVPIAAVQPEGTLKRYLSWMNFIKVLGVIFIVVAFWSAINKMIGRLWSLLVQVPVVLYQVALLGTSLYATLFAQSVWPSEAIYLALVAAFVNLFAAGWILAEHPKLAAALKRILTPGIPVSTMVCLLTMLYFGALALHYHSSIFGFFTIVALSGMLSFGMHYSSGTLSLMVHNVRPVVLGHLAVLLAYATLVAMHVLPAWASVFIVGVEYYCTIALCTGLLVATAPWGPARASVATMSLLFILVFMAATAAYFFLDLKVIGSIVSCFFILFVLEWIARFGYRSGAVAGSALLGIALYGIALLLEKYSNYIVLSLA